jgi:hypothetical protein
MLTGRGAGQRLETRVGPEGAYAGGKDVEDLEGVRHCEVRK